MVLINQRFKLCRVPEWNLSVTQSFIQELEHNLGTLTALDTGTGHYNIWNYLCARLKFLLSIRQDLSHSLIPDWCPGRGDALALGQWQYHLFHWDRTTGIPPPQLQTSARGTHFPLDPRHLCSPSACVQQCAHSCTKRTRTPNCL